MIDGAKFQSTHPVRGATLALGIPKGDKGISIHAPREGCDDLDDTLALRARNFNPRTP